jgi:hypothetical protein
MKKLTVLIVLFCVVFMSCSDNDDKSNVIIPGPPVGTEVRYEVSAEADIITDIKFNKADATVADGTISSETPNQWSFTIIVAKPFAAEVKADFVNTSSIQINGAMDIYVDGILAAHRPVAVPANGTLSESLQQIVQ